MAKRKATPDLMGNILGGQAKSPEVQKSSSPDFQTSGDLSPLQRLKNYVSGDRTQATLYLSEATFEGLDEAQIRLRKLTGKDKKIITRSLIAEIALQASLADLEENGADSELARRLAEL